MKPIDNLRCGYFRISVTKRCNFSCSYCHHEGQINKGTVDLSADDIAWVSMIAKKKGYEKFKLTGGEPTLRGDICEIISLLSDNGRNKVTMITNGSLLLEKIEDMKEAGLTAINVSLNYLRKNPDLRHSDLGLKMIGKIIQGIEKSINLGYSDMKLNFVYHGVKSLMDLDDVIEFSAPRNLTVVVLPVMNGRKRGEKGYVSLEEIYGEFRRKGIRAETIMRDGEGMRKRLITMNTGAKILLRIDELSDRSPYKECNECPVRLHCREGIFALRLSADGVLTPCLSGGLIGIRVAHLVRGRHTDKVSAVFDHIRRMELGSDAFVPHA